MHIAFTVNQPVISNQVKRAVTGHSSRFNGFDHKERVTPKKKFILSTFNLSGLPELRYTFVGTR